MRVYVETNFILELAFEQEQSAACDAILRLAEVNAVRLSIPAFCFTEPHGRFRRQSHERNELQKELARQVKEFEKSLHTTDEQLRAWSTISALLVSSGQVAERRFNTLRSRLLQATQLLPLTAPIIEEGAQGRDRYGLQFPDSLVLSSVLIDLRSNQGHSCFLNKNSDDFNNSLIVTDLKKAQCKPIWRFDHGLEHVRAMLQMGTE